MAAVTCLQKILFGPPGCGKSFRVRKIAEEELGITVPGPRLIETTFHPEYGYGDFLAKLLPQTSKYQQKYLLSAAGPIPATTIQEEVERSSIEYNIHTGPLLKALALAYADPGKNVLLVIDEINRGNCAQIFGDIFQLLDRNDSGRSEYGVELCQLFHGALQNELQRQGAPASACPAQKLYLPPNLSLIGTMNTSDESVYYMDSAFKRRWDFAFMPWSGQPGGVLHERQRSLTVEGVDGDWISVLTRLNDYIAGSFRGRNIDDKQIGLWFVKVPLTAPEKLGAALEALKVKLAPLVGKSGHGEWVKIFPKAESYGFGENLLTVSAKADFEAFGAGWPADVNPYQPELLAAKLIEHIDAFLDVPAPRITLETIRNKLMFFLWDNVFSRDRSPLFALLRLGGMAGGDPRTFGEFATPEHAAMLLAGLLAPAETASA
ncbi:AAA family ATPase [Pseudoduganella violacea]|uniref:5-methylcytosine-specific restriction endonuclease McrBC GTP-binding regulatory subunit McrB n=1 Tax=Pseudoduganella violacea TaxID=1715466 RepID=A0A7W5FW01_9BURK|nr:AAA family ATPase [Pseudoduganella violacea]MBB3120743.1 5-methylcytosine-specific restriction endonuclease McrBC GTP-binding regulatory subunit McrB [Pseudoduganella violacea]